MKTVIFIICLFASFINATVITGQFVECGEIPEDTVQICYYDSTAYGVLTGGMNRMDAMVIITRDIESRRVCNGITKRYIILSRDSVSGQYTVWNTYMIVPEIMKVSPGGAVEFFNGLRHRYIMTYLTNAFRTNKIFYSNWNDYYTAWKTRLLNKK